MNKNSEILNLFNENAEVVERSFLIKNKKVCLYFIDCLINKQLFSVSVVDNLEKLEQIETNNFCDTLENKLLSVASVKRTKDYNMVQTEIFDGSVVIKIENEPEMLIVGLTDFSKRSIAEPPNASVVRGPREGFIEEIETNISLIRRRIKSPALSLKRVLVGKRTSTKVCLLYLSDVANIDLVNLLEKKLKNINVDGVIDSYYLEELLETDNEKFFKKFGNAEKPDVVASRILEGRVAIVVDGSPIVLTLPYLLFEDMQSPGDYYDIPARASFVRIVRLVGLLFAILLPGMYVALQSYHYRVLPISFLITLLSNIEGISFPPILEILFVLFLFEILNEASVRMPKQLGMAMSIIGALVLGDTAVQAGIITPPSIVVVAISGITLYIIPNQASEASLLRTLFTVIGGIAGFYGIFLGFLVLISYLVSINNYGAAYMSPYAPSINQDKKDGFIKKPLSEMIYRPKSFKNTNPVRLKIKENNNKKQNLSGKKKSLKNQNGGKNGIN